jgi:Rod binding domain-containing protein
MNLIDTSLHTFKAVPRQGISEGNSMSLEEQRAALKKTAKEFEAIFMFQMVSAMRKTVPQNDGGLIKKSNGEKIFEGMLDEEWAKRLSGQGGESGLSGMIYSQLSRKLGLEEGQQVDGANRPMPMTTPGAKPLMPVTAPSNAVLELQRTGAMPLNPKDQSGDGHE